MNQPKTIYWIPHEGLKYPPLKKSGSTWLIYTQAALKLEAEEKKTIGLNFGLVNAGGLIVVVPTDEIKKIWSLKILFSVKIGQITLLQLFTTSQNQLC